MRNNFRSLSSAGITAILGLALVMTASCSNKEQKTAVAAVPVTVETAGQRDVPQQISAIGTVESSSAVGIRAQVGGTLTRVHFTEGQDVKKGDLLFTIDQRLYEAALRQAEANLSRSLAQSVNARAEERRYAELVKKGYVSQTQYEQVRTNADAFDATMHADMALVENARLNLNYCTIRSPLSGRTGSLIMHEGNLIKANADTPMVTIHQIQPVQAAFALPEKNLPEVRRHMTAGALKVEAFLSREDSNPVTGRLAFVENTVDVATGTIKLKATFENSDQRLWPGQFVIVVMTMSVQKDATVVAAGAVQTAQQGQFVFVVKDDQTAEMRQISAGQTFQDVVVVNKGLRPGERVVTDGQMRLIPGAKVVVKDGQEEKAKGAAK